MQWVIDKTKGIITYALLDLPLYKATHGLLIPKDSEAEAKVLPQWSKVA